MTQGAGLNAKKGENMVKKEKVEILVPDTSVIIEGDVSKKILDKSLIPQVIMIHEAVIAELEHQANSNRAIGYLGLNELKSIRKVCDKNNIKLDFAGTRPKLYDIQNAKLGEIDSLIREFAYEKGAVLMTADKVQAKVAEAKGIQTIFVEVGSVAKKLKLEKFFDKTSMSVHLRENIQPFAKKGFPGSWKFEHVGKKKLTREDIQDISREIIEEANVRRDSFIEIERPGSTIVQLDKFRIVITRPPFSDAWEITAVRPVKKLTLKEYKLSEKLLTRVGEQAEGILIAGSPGMGKSTFAAALAEHYASMDKVVKTVEAPRDLVLPESITQYAISHGDAQEVHDILLLSRPDHTFFDEMRNTDDFKLFADLRLAGIGFIGIVHATNPIDAIQRFVGRIELGVIPQVIDTVIFIKNGNVSKILSLSMVVKVPSGMTEADLARPIVVVNDFESGKLEFELYSYGEETVVIPVSGDSGSSPAKKLASRQIEKEIKQYCEDAKVEVVDDHKCIVYVPEHKIASLIGKQGKRIAEIEKNIGIGIDIRELEVNVSKGKRIEFRYDIGKKNVNLYIDDNTRNKVVNILINGNFHMTAKISKKGIIKIKKNSGPGRVIVDAINLGHDVELVK